MRASRPLSACVLVATLLSLLVAAPATADHTPDEPDGPYTDQTLSGDPECSSGQFPGERTLVGAKQRQTFVPSRGELSALDLCLRSSGTNLFHVAILDAAGNTEGAVDLLSQDGTGFQRVTFDGVLGLEAGQTYTVEVAGPGGVDTPSLALAWRLTCVPALSLRSGERCSSLPADRYADGVASDGAYGPNADFGFRTLTPTTANLVPTASTAPDHLCRERSFPSSTRVTNLGDADVRASQLSVTLVRDGAATGDVLGEVDLPPLGPGQSVDVRPELAIPADALGGEDGRAQVRFVVDAEDVVVESDETDNVAAVPTVLTGCGPVELAAVDLETGAPTVPAGVGLIPVGALPIGTIPFGGSGLAATPLHTNPLHTNPLNTNPLNTNPLNTNPLLDAPLNTNPLNTNPLNTNPLNTNPLNTNSFLFGAPHAVLSQVPLSSITLLRPGGWTALLERHAEIVAATGSGSEPLDEVPLQRLTLLDVMQLDPVPTPPITFGELDLSQGPLGGLVLAAVATGATPLADIALPGGGTWCDTLLADQGLDCTALAIDEDEATLVTVNLLGLDATKVPFDTITAADVALHPDAPLARVSLQSADPTREFDARLTPWSTVAVTGGLAELVDCAATSCGDGLTLGQVTADDAFVDGGTLADLLAALPPATLATATLGDLIRGTIHNAAALPFENARLDAVPLAELVQDGPFVTYQLTVVVADTGASVVDPTLQVRLPDRFAYVPGSAQLQAADTQAVLGEPTVTTESSGRTSLTWSPDLFVAHGDTVVLRLDANPGAVLGAHVAEATVSGQDLTGTYHGSATTEVDVTERFEPDDPDGPESDWTELPADTLAFSHLSRPGDLDVWRIPVPATEHARVKIVLSHLPADYDLLLGGATANPLNTNPLNTNPLNTNPLNTNPLHTNRVVPEDGSDPRANQPEQGVPPETLQDLPLHTNPLNTNGIRAVSVERGTDHEVIVIERIDGEAGYYPLVVSGYNGASSPEPYVLRQHVVAPARIDLGACQPAPFVSGTGDEGVAPDPASVDPATDTLFLVARQRLTDRFGPDGRDQVLDAVTAVAARGDLGVHGLVVPIEGDPAIDAAYETWDGARCDPVAANGVAGAARDLVLEYRRHLPITHVVVIGDDDQIPFLRVRDGAVLGNEVQFVSSIVADTGSTGPDGEPANGTPLTAALQAGLFLTDDHLGTAQARPWLDQAVWIPDVAVGRASGDVATIVGAFEQFVDSSATVSPDVLAPTASAVAGYDHLADGATAVADHLDERLAVTAARLIDETWTRSDLEGLLSFTSTDRDAVVSPSGHADHRRLLPALGNLTGAHDELYEATALAGALPVASVVFSMACHFGYDLPATGTVRDWADAVTARHGVLVANTGFNYGDTDTVAAGELFTSLLAGHLDGTLTVGEAVATTKADVYAREGQFAAEFLKAMQGMVTYGLPMYRVAASAPPAADDGVELSDVRTDPTTGLDYVDVDLNLPLVADAASCPAGASCLVPVVGERGTYHRVVGALGYEPLAITGRPTGPRAVLDVSELIDGARRVHGAAVLSASSEDLTGVDAAFARATLARPEAEPEPEALGVIFPTLPLRVSTVDTPRGERQLLTLLPWTFRSDPGAPPGTGTFRLDTQLSLRLYLSEDADNRPSEVRTVRARRQGDAVTLDVTTAAVGGVTRAVSALYRDEFGAWHRAPLSSSDGERWFGVGSLPGASVQPIELLVQTVDEHGDTGFWRNKGVRVPIAAEPGSLPFTLSGSPGDNGWYLGEVTIDLPPTSGGSYQVRLDGGPWVTVEGNRVTVTSDGVHHVDIVGPDGSEVRDLIVAIDTTPPSIDLRTPSDGASYREDDAVEIDFVCADATSTVAACEGTQPDGATLDLVQGSDRTFTVEARDRAGHTATAVATYDVFAPPIDFVGFFSPLVNDRFNDVPVDDGGTTVPLKWRLYRAGELLDDVALVADVTWQPISCAGSPDEATALGPAVPADSENDQGVMVVARRMQFEAVVPASFAGTCQVIEVVLTDGAHHPAWFRFTEG